MNYYTEVLKKYAVFTGRARRAEYWYYALFTVIIALVLYGLAALFRGSVGGLFSVLGGVYGIATLLPGIGVTVRRLHDTGRSGWWILIDFVPFVGWIVLLVFMCMDSQPGENKWGPNPKGAYAAAAAPSSLV